MRQWVKKQAPDLYALLAEVAAVETLTKGEGPADG